MCLCTVISGLMANYVRHLGRSDTKFSNFVHETRRRHLIRRLSLLLGGLIQQLQRRQGCDAFGSLSI